MVFSGTILYSYISFIIGMIITVTGYWLKRKKIQYAELVMAAGLSLILAGFGFMGFFFANF